MTVNVDDVDLYLFYPVPPPTQFLLQIMFILSGEVPTLDVWPRQSLFNTQVLR